MKQVTLEHTDILIKYPSIDYFISILRDSNPYQFLRFNHGIIDSFVDGYDNYDVLIKQAEQNEFKAISDTIYNGYKNSQWGFNYYNLNSESTLDKINAFVKIFFLTNSYIPKLEMGISSGVGMGYVFGTYAPDFPIQLKRNDVIKRISKLTNTKYFHSGIFRHFSVMGDMFKFFNVANELNYNIITIGPNYLRLLKETYNISKFNMVSTPTKGAADFLDEYINDIKGIIKSNSKNILLTSVGTIGSCYIAEKLKDENIISIDIGRSLDWDLRQYQSTEPTMPKGDCWISPAGRGDVSEIYKNYINNLRNG